MDRIDGPNIEREEGPALNASSSTVRNPWDDSVVGTAALGGLEEAEEAIETCLRGFQVSRALPSFERAASLESISRGIQSRREEFAQLITREVGKPIQFSRNEVDRAVGTFQIAAEESKRVGGETLPLDMTETARNRFGVVRRFPIGIVLCISPFNFPLNLVAHKVAPAMAAGNAFIIKPPPQAPLTGLKLAELIETSGYPREACRVLPCSNEVASKLVEDSRIKMVSFTGSPAVGWMLKSRAGKKKVLLELGGNAGVIIDESADLDDAVRKNIVGSFLFAGQVCIKIQRIYVHKKRFEEYRSKFVSAAGNIRAGDPQEPSTLLGPMVDDAAAERVSGWIAEAVRSGAQLRAGGTRRGRLLDPTVLENVGRSTNLFGKEVFGPVVTLSSFESIEQAVQDVNDSVFGLQAGIFSNNHRNILYAYNHLDVGALIVNDNPTFRVDSMPYGGVKDSGFGREGIRYAIDEMTEPKLLVLGA
ncbi:MAG TPA: aldehyde dehydrogenase family protein [Bacteroidota bacterium]|nr:aldehyde dehydrogenase family protein [Bacteroidota bacterium]